MKITNENIASFLPTDFANESKVWIYQSTQAFTDAQQKEMDAQLKTFANAWQSHGAKVKGWGQTMFHHFVVLMADESNIGVGGCSTDSSVRLIKSFEEQFGLSLFDRMQVAFLQADKIQVLPLANLNTQTINQDDFYFDNLVATKKEMSNHWLKPIHEGWLGKRVSAQIV
jgi:hypothetical protein